MSLLDCVPEIWIHFVLDTHNWVWSSFYFCTTISVSRTWISSADLWKHEM